MFKRILIIVFFSQFIFANCHKKDDVVPNVYVNFTIDLSSIQYSKLNIIGGYIYVTGGVNGILIYRNGQNEFYAYDRTCTYHTEENRKIFVQESDKIFAIDTVCGSRFFLLDGSPEKGPAKAPLRKYSADYIEASNMLHVYN